MRKTGKTLVLAAVAAVADDVMFVMAGRVLRLDRLHEST